MAKNKFKIGVLICAYNEEKHIRKVIEKTLKKIKKVIVVNDGSSDNTLKEIKKTKAITINKKINKGKGLALKTGFSYAKKQKYDYLILMDADGQHNSADIPKFIKKIKKESPDLIIGTRKKRHSDMPYLRRFVNFFTSALISAKAKTKIKDSQSGYRAIKLSSLKKINLKGKKYDLESEILVKMGKQKMKITSVPIKTIYGEETSTINPVKDSFRFFRALFRKN